MFVINSLKKWADEISIYIRKINNDSDKIIARPRKGICINESNYLLMKFQGYLKTFLVQNLMKGL